MNCGAINRLPEPAEGVSAIYVSCVSPVSQLRNDRASSLEPSTVKFMFNGSQSGLTTDLSLRQLSIHFTAERLSLLAGARIYLKVIR